MPLKKDHISKIPMFEIDNPNEYNSGWKQAHLGIFTSSEIFNLMGEKPFTKGAMSYIYRKVGEAVSGIAAKDEVFTNAIDWGNANEIQALIRFREIHQIEEKASLFRQQFIHNPDSRFGSTPDLIIPVSELPDAYNVITVEAKCPYTYDAYLSLYMCNTPLDLKKVEPKYYWQTLDQLDNCDTLEGWFCIYQPKFQFGDYKEIKFRIMEKIEFEYPLLQDLRLLRDRKTLAEKKFNEIRDLLLKN